MLLSWLRVIFMTLNDFKQEAILEVKKQALNHVFYAEDIKNNFSNVRKFEEKYQISLLEAEQVLEYWNQLVREQKYSSKVALNAKEYLNLITEEQGRNFLMNALRIMVPISGNEDFWIARLYQCNGLFEIIKAMIEPSMVASEKAYQFITSHFSFTSQVMDQMDESTSSLLLNEEFLKYCSYLLKSNSPLLQEDLFVRQLVLLMRVNGMHEGYCYNDLSSLKANFFHMNRNLARRITDNF